MKALEDLRRWGSWKYCKVTKEKALEFPVLKFSKLLFDLNWTSSKVQLTQISIHISMSFSLFTKYHTPLVLFIIKLKIKLKIFWSATPDIRNFTQFLQMWQFLNPKRYSLLRKLRISRFRLFRIRSRTSCSSLPYLTPFVLHKLNLYAEQTITKNENWKYLRWKEKHKNCFK